MYRKRNRNQENFLDGFYMPFGGKLSADNRWVIKAGIMPWDFIEDEYAETFKNDKADGRPPIPARIAFGAIFIKESEGLVDETTVTAIRENPYIQYFLGLSQFEQEPLFDPSMMAQFRKRFSADIINRVNEEIHRRNRPSDPTGGGANKGKMILDATCAPSDIRYPTDISILNECRENIELILGDLWGIKKWEGHKLPYMPKRARAHFCAYVKKKKHSRGKTARAVRKQLDYVKQALAALEAKLPECNAALTDRAAERVQTIMAVVSQQQEMLDKETHSVADRIVSVSQPHVRPIVRGKAGAKVEFGQKMSVSVVDGYTFVERQDWNNFNEGLTLKECIEGYHARFGCYPEAILADTAYRNRENIKHCKSLGIRLSGKPLGRPKASEAENTKKQEYADSCERNEVEGRFGICKRKYGLDLIMSKLSENALTEAVLNVLAMNVAHLIRARLCLFFKKGSVLGISGFNFRNLGSLFIRVQGIIVFT